jgi:REP element-mobilizing transposase RayT
MSGLRGWGGKRRGAGRPNKSGTVAHGKREDVNFKLPLILTLRLRKGLPNIRQVDILKLFQTCCGRVKHFDFHVLHFSIQSNHIHLIAEAKDNEALARGMQSLVSSFAKKLKVLMRSWKKAVSWEGSVFVGRYHLRKILSPTQMKNTLKYVLLNWVKHSEFIEHMDDFSSGRAFTRWKELLGRDFRLLIAMEAKNPPHDPVKMGISPPRSWLAREGWMRAA